MAGIEFHQVTRRYHGSISAVNALDLQLPGGEISVLTGPSGGGKTTILRLIAGLEAPDAGKICFDGEEITAVLPNRRGVGMTFQNYVLLPHLTVYKNIAFGLSRTPDRHDRVMQVASQLELTELANRKPQALSGGQQQRVALARLLASRPRIALLDEPLSHVDIELANRLQEVILQWQRQYRSTVVFVTHNPNQARSIADHWLEIADGQLANGPNEELPGTSPSFSATRHGNKNAATSSLATGMTNA